MSESTATSTQPSGEQSLAFELLAVRLGDVVHELSRPQLQVHRPDPNEGVHRGLTARWEQLQMTVADAIATETEAIVEPEIARYLAAVIRHHASPLDQLRHNSWDGRSFRVGLTETVTPTLGVPLTAGLVRRPLLGLVTTTYPFIGWASNIELHRTLEHVGPVDHDKLQAASIELQVFVRCIETSASSGHDLVAIYDSPQPHSTVELV